jgi:metal transporter CNNM
MSSIPSYVAWFGVTACVVQSGLFAGLNLAVFSLSLLRLQIEADGGNSDALRVIELRKDANQVLATVIWGNVITNVLLTLLSDSVLTGLGAFFFSTFAITLLGEIVPQAYFSRNALRMTSRCLPFLTFYRVILFPVAKPTAMLLDWWLGSEGIAYLKEHDIRLLLARHAAIGGEIGRLEATGAQNFLDLDDVSICDEGEIVVIRDMKARLGDVIGRMKVVQERPEDDVIENDLILVWGSQKRIITGSDLLGRLLRGIATVEPGRA